MSPIAAKCCETIDGTPSTRLLRRQNIPIGANLGLGSIPGLPRPIFEGRSTTPLESSSITATSTKSIVSTISATLTTDISTATNVSTSTTSSSASTTPTRFSSTSTIGSASATATSDPSSSTHSSSGVIGGSIVGILLLSALGAGIFFFLRRRRWQRQTRNLQARITPLEREVPSDNESPRNVGLSEKGRSLLTTSAYTQPPDLIQTIPSFSSFPSQDPSRSEQQIMLEPEDVQSQMTSIKATVAQMLEHVRRIEARVEEADLPPPTYISS